MGAGRSKSMLLSYEEACKRVPAPVLQRLQDTFKRFSTASGYLPQLTFNRDVLGEAVPAKLAEAIYESFGGGQKGIGLKDLVCGLVLLTHGSKQEKARFIGQLVCGEGEKVTRERLDSLVVACDHTPTVVNLDTLFGDGKVASLDNFESWVMENAQLASFTLWLLAESGLSLEGPADPPSFHQTLAERYNVEEQMVLDLEKSYWSLKGGGKFDLSTLESYVSPPLPTELCADLFRVMDVNRDGHIDLPELIGTVASITRGNNDSHNFCFKLFDRDEDNLLSRSDLVGVVSVLISVKESNRAADDTTTLNEEMVTEEIADSILQAHSKEKDGHLTVSEYLSWVNERDLGEQLIKILVEICHMRFGLKPVTPELEGVVVNGYLNRFHKARRCHGDIVYIMPSEWFTQWRVYTAQEEEAPTKHHKKHKKKSKSRSKSQHISPHSSTVAQPHNIPPEAIELNSIGLASFSETTPPTRPPPIDNSTLCVTEQTGSKKLPSLTNEGGRLVRSRVLIEGKDYVVLPEVVWKAFVSWYGTVGYSVLSLPRIVDANGVVDLYPLVFKLYRHTTNPVPTKTSNLPWPLGSLLTSIGIMNPPTTVTTPLLSGDEGTQTPQPRRVPYYQAAFPRSTTLAEVSEIIQNALRVKSEDLRLYNYCSDEPSLMECEETTLEDLGLKDGDKLLVETRNKDNSWPEEIIAIMKEVIVKDKDKPRQQSGSEVKVPPGATGLSNLGNTCFMNSALQCVSNTQPLTTYFREKDHLIEINKDNPLGTGGVLAKRYGELIDDLWTGSSKSVTPLKFRFTVGRHAPQFNGFQQQDCQELLAFLLDGLHEDLNRVKEKAYRELDDSDGRDDAVVAQEAWDYHLSRNQSIIVDLFQGQLKSVVTCKECQFTSVRFDPFTFLSLPLPMESTVNLEVIVVLLDGSQPIRYGLRLELDDKYRQLKTELSQLCGLNQSLMLLVEVYGGIIRSIPSDSTKIRSVLGGWLYAYEIPPASPVIPTSRADSPDEPRRQAKVIEVRRERAHSLHMIEEERKRARLAQANLLSHDPLAGSCDQRESRDIDTEAANESHDLPQESCDLPDKSHDLPTTEVQDAAPSNGSPLTAQETIISGLEGSDGFVFAFHRRMFSVEHFFVASQKSRPVIFGTPLVVPCDASSPRSSLYECVWTQVQRLMIPDPPNKGRSPEHGGTPYPFVLKLVAKDGMACGQCPWYRFCSGCPLTCDDGSLGRTSGNLAVDWDSTTLHLKYQSAQERPVEHSSMESLKITDNKPIALDDCFRAFVRQDELGDEESWYCKRCKTHREAIKSLEIWKLPSVLIIHLKRFQFFNGRWVKSQRDVSFPLMNLDPLRHTAHNSNGTNDQTRSHSMDTGSHTEEGESYDQPMDDLMEVSDGQIDQSHDQQMESCDDLDSSTPSQASKLYDLFAICCHSGVMGGGHYVSFARNPNSKWYYFNDSSCKECSEERVLEESPYLLFYELQGLNNEYNRFRVQRSGGKGQDVGTDDDREFEETLKNLRKSCSIQ